MPALSPAQNGHGAMGQESEPQSGLFDHATLHNDRLSTSGHRWMTSKHYNNVPSNSCRSL